MKRILDEGLGLMEGTAAAGIVGWLDGHYAKSGTPDPKTGELTWELFGLPGGFVVGFGGLLVGMMPGVPRELRPHAMEVGKGALYASTASYARKHSFLGKVAVDANGQPAPKLFGDSGDAILGPASHNYPSQTQLAAELRRLY